MSKISSDVARLRSRIANTRRHHPDQDVSADREALQRAKVEAHIADLIASAPPLTAEQRDRLASLLSGVPILPTGQQNRSQDTYRAAVAGAYQTRGR